MDLIELLQEPFMLRAIYGGIIIAIITSSLGVFITLKKQSYISDGIAHASLAGIAAGILLSFQPILLAMVVAVLMAIFITYFRKRTSIAIDSLIGISYSFLFALGILIINLSPGFKPELFSFLFGSILGITWSDITISVIVFFIIIVALKFLYKKLLYATFDPEAAYIRGINTEALEYFLNILTSVVIIISIKIVGVILVTALLVIPATAAKLLAQKFSQMIPISIIFGLISMLIGIFASYFIDTPPGATVVIVEGILFLLVFLISKLRAN